MDESTVWTEQEKYKVGYVSAPAPGWHSHCSDSSNGKTLIKTKAS